MSIEARRRMLCFALQKVGAPYVWGCKGHDIWTPGGLVPTRWREAYDCSGLASASWKFASGYDHRAQWSCDVMYNALEPISEPKAGTLAFYGHGTTATHVAIHIWGGMVICATNGDATVCTPEDAKKRAAETGIPCAVHVYCDYLYRKDFIGWRELPFTQE